MIRGTTPYVTITFPTGVDVSDMTKFRMYFNQGKDNVLTKTEDDLTFVAESRTVTALLTQEETMLFNPKKRVEIAARYMFSGGIVGAIKPRYIDVYDVDGDTDEILSGE